MMNENFDLHHYIDDLCLERIFSLTWRLFPVNKDNKKTMRRFLRKSRVKSEDYRNLRNIESIEVLEKYYLKGYVLSSTFQEYCDHNLNRKEQKYQSIALAINLFVAFRFAVTIFIDDPTVLAYLGDVLVFIGHNERRLCYIILFAAAVSMALCRIVYIIGNPDPDQNIIQYPDSCFRRTKP